MKGQFPGLQRRNFRFYIFIACLIDRQMASDNFPTLYLIMQTETQILCILSGVCNERWFIHI